MNNPKVIVPDYTDGEGKYVYDGKTWCMSTLRDATVGLPVFDLQLAAIDLSMASWKINNMANYIYHHKRTVKASLKYPIIMDPTGYIIDGWHRVAKAILEGKTEVKAIRLLVMPEPDETAKEY